MLSKIIYLDNNASTAADPVVIDAITSQLREGYGNPSGEHIRARAAAEVLTTARRRLGELVDAPPSSLFFTSGATESNNTVFASLPDATAGRRRVLLSAIEHRSVLEPARTLTRRGYVVQTLPVPDTGVLDVERAREKLGPDVALVALMLANNETGHVQPVAELTEAAHAVGAQLHCDATQAVGKMPVSLTDLEVDFASFNAHKMHGPMGVGALYVRRGATISPLMHGGGQQRGLRAGTENVPAIAGFGVAAAVAQQHLDSYIRNTRGLIRILADALHCAIPVLQVLSSPEGLPNTLLVRLPGLEADQVLANAPLIAASTGSACATLSPEPSHVLTAIWQDDALARQCLRLSVGRFTTEEEVRLAAAHLAAAVKTVRYLRAAS